jgi:triosephosphate isomerase
MPFGDARPAFYFGTNLKMHQTARETVTFLDGLWSTFAPLDARLQLFVIPPYTSLAAVAGHPARERIWIGAQNMHWEASGAFTGEISAPMLSEFDIDLVLLGHAERRAHFGESDAIVNRKVRAALKHKMRALVCVGETAEERAAGAGVETTMRQLRMSLDGVEAEEREKIIVAYEPVWSIGEGGTPARPDDVREVLQGIGRVLTDRFGDEQAPPVLYGGSVDAENAPGFAALRELDGLFVGRAAWSVEGFSSTLDRALSARPKAYEHAGRMRDR